MAALLSIFSYCSIKRLAMINFAYGQQDHKLNGVGIINFSVINFSRFLSNFEHSIDMISQATLVVWDI